MVAIFPASTSGGGTCSGQPDVCKTPSPTGTVPIPYPNTGQVAMAVKTSLKVSLSSMPAVTLKSEIPMSQMDEPGVQGGVVSGVNMGKVTFLKGSLKVMVEGSPLVHLTSVAGHNGSPPNVPMGSQIAPSQVKVVVSP